MQESTPDGAVAIPPLGAAPKDSRITPQFDILTALPVHLAKQVLMYLDFVELEAIKAVSNAWKTIAQEVCRDKEHRRDADDFVLDLKVRKSITCYRI